MTDHDHEHIGLVLEFDGDGELTINGTRLPDALAESIAAAVIQARASAAAVEMERFVTPEVAHHVLSAYGDETARMPSLSTAALIQLIRTCVISDEEMLDNLNHVDDFHGYVLAITILVQPHGVETPDQDGLALLREIAAKA